MLKPIIVPDEDAVKWAKSLPLDTVIARLSGTKLNRRGSKYMGLCPLHNDRDTPSLVVYRATNSWVCYSPNCGSGPKRNGGDTIEFTRQYRKCSFIDAVKWLQFEFGNAVIEQPEPVKIVKTTKTYNLNTIKYYHSLMDLSEQRYRFYDRGFRDSIINRELWGYDGFNLVIPIWELEPGNSNVVCVKLRPIDRGNGPKYIRQGYYGPYFWGLWYVEYAPTIIAFAGELDAARAVQDGLPAFSVLNGAGSYSEFDSNWPNVWFPNAQKLIVVFDRKEEVAAAKMAQSWSEAKGAFTGSIYHWIDFQTIDDKPGKDYCNWRDAQRSVDEFLSYMPKGVI